jgi:hypothetical protein
VHYSAWKALESCLCCVPCTQLDMMCGPKVCPGYKRLCLVHCFCSYPCPNCLKCPPPCGVAAFIPSFLNLHPAGLPLAFHCLLTVLRDLPSVTLAVNVQMYFTVQPSSFKAELACTHVFIIVVSNNQCVGNASYASCSRLQILEMANRGQVPNIFQGTAMKSFFIWHQPANLPRLEKFPIPMSRHPC